MKKIFTLFMVALLGAGMYMQANVSSGSCGDNLTWEVTGEPGNYVLTISGTGAMDDYDLTYAPWQEYVVGIRTINLPDGITHLGNNAFISTSVSNMVVPNSVVSIGNNCFAVNEWMQTLSLPANLTTIGYRAFDGCGLLTSLTIPAGVTSIGDGLLANCESLTNLTVEAGNTVYECPEGSNVIVTKAAPVTLISGCKNAVIPSNVTVIAPFAFQLASLTAITIPNGVTTIQDRAFSDCVSLQSLFIPAGVTQIAPNAFMHNRLASITVDAANTVYESPENSNAIIERASHKLVTGCGKTLIPDDVTSIGDWAFFQTEISTITIPANVQAIGVMAFGMCGKLLEIICESTTPPSLVVTETSHTFGYRDESSTAYHETSRNIPVYVPVGALAAYQAAEGWNEFLLKEITERPTTDPGQDPDPTPLPDPCEDSDLYRGTCGEHLNWVLTCEGELVISGYGPMTSFMRLSETPWYAKNSEIKSVSLPNGLTTISDYAFEFSDYITEIDIPASVTTIGYCAFSTCRLLKAVNFPANSQLQSIGANAFSYTKLDSLYIPASVSNIGYGITASCKNIVKITVDASNAFYDSRNDCNAIIRKSDNALIAGCKNTVIQNDVTRLCGEALHALQFTTPIEIPESVTVLERYALGLSSGLTSLTLPAGVTTLGAYAVAISSLDTLTSMAVVPPAAETTTFNSVDKSIPLYVPAASVTAYRTANVWKEFTNILPIQGDEPIEEPEQPENCVLSGQCNSNVTWSLDTCSGKLTIAGNDTMPDYSILDASPWSIYKQFITSVEVKEGVLYVGGYAFYQNYKIKTVKLPSTLQKIRGYAFGSCNALETVELQSIPNYLHTQAFNLCGNLDTIYCPCDDALYMGEDNYELQLFYDKLYRKCDKKHPAFYGYCGAPVQSENLAWRFEDGLLSFTGSGAMADYLVEPEDNYIPWADLYSYTFNITLPNGLTVIGANAFMGRENVKTVVIPSSVTEIHEDAFNACYSMDTIFMSTPAADLTWDDELENLPDFKENKATICCLPTQAMKEAYEAKFTNVNVTFATLEKQTEEPIEEPEEEITLSCIDAEGACGDQLHWAVNCTGDTLLITGKGDMYDYDFFNPTPWDAYTYSIKHVEIRKGITSIGNYGLNSINNIKSISIPEGVEHLGQYALYFCSSLESISLPNSLKSIDEYAFGGCTKLAAIVIPSSVQTIDATLFNSCPNLVSIIVSPTNTHFDSRDNCNAIIETATNTLVRGCKATVIPEDVTKLGEKAFTSLDSLKSMTIPAAVTNLMGLAFSGCENLQSLTCLATTPPQPERYYDQSTFSNVPTDIPVYIPVGTTAAYQAAKAWERFTNFIEMGNQYYVKALANHGQVNGTGLYAANTVVELTAVPDEGFRFNQWSDGTTTNPKSLTVTQDTTIRALFEKIAAAEPQVIVVGAVAPEPELQEINISFEPVEDATFYELKVYMNGKLVATVKLTGSGQLIGGIEWASAPSRMKVREAVNDNPALYSINLSQLEFGQEYTFTLDAYNEEEECISAQVGSFNVPEPSIGTSTESLEQNGLRLQKILRNGQLFIIRGEDIFTPQGQLVK